MVLLRNSRVTGVTCGMSRQASADHCELHHTPLNIEGVVMTAGLTGSVIVVSDRVHAGEREDLAGPLARDLLTEAGVDVRGVTVVPEGADAVADRLAASLAEGVRVIVTIGGTGVGPRNRTPDVTAGLLAVRLPGVSTQILLEGLKSTPTAGLSRGLVGLTERGPGATLIVNAPGSRGGVRDALGVICPLLPDLLHGSARD